MKEQLVSFDIATLAKEKGFNINTYSDCWVKTLDGDIIHNSERKDLFTPEHERCEQYLMQPTQTVLQKWLRERHNSHIYVYPVSLGNYKCCHFKGGFNTFCKSEFMSYEDALEYGLLEELKNI